MPQTLSTIPRSIIVYPSSDGQPMAETGIHVLLMTALYQMLRDHYHYRQDVYVTANIFLYYSEGDPTRRRSPDVMVVKGVPSQPERDSFKVWEERANPSVIFELTSKGTSDEDLGPKKELYQLLGVREYFLYDPLAEYLPRQLMGYRLISRAENGDEAQPIAEYEELPPAADGSLISAELGLRLVPAGQLLDLVDLRTGKRLPYPSEYRREAESTRQRAEKEQQRAEKEQQRADQLRKKNEHLEQELKRLRSLLPPETGDASDGTAG